ncbi:hypothetical protein HJC23_011274 [Cyclotella cryptica]|uniref:Uncharacterized protein n=1 Tax=Cyclotella cryptica TaxID=29204 RepID=A0ABD3QWY1_9STRA
MGIYRQMQPLLVLAFVTSLPAASSFAVRTTDGSARRDFLQSIAITTSAAVFTVSTYPGISNAAYGDSSNIVMPNYIEYLIEKNKQVDPNDLLYKGPDLELQLRRIGEAANRLPEIASLCGERKWSQVQGIITGPLGTLLQTMNSLASAAGTKEAKDAAKLVKNDLIEISAAAGKKDSSGCIKASEKASKDLEKFVKLL